MSNIQKAFQNGKAFIAFLTCGDPDLETTAKIVKGIASSGADIIELGIPFSDPTAEGPVIQAANVRALWETLRRIAFLIWCSVCAKR
jgi:tryptophan synthase alpha chain